MTRRQEFSANTKAKAFRRANERCEICTRKVGLGGEPAEYDHHPVSADDGGSNDLSNCRVLCRECHLQHTRQQTTERAEGRRHLRRRAGVRPSRKWRRPLPGSRDSGWKAKVGGGWERRND